MDGSVAAGAAVTVDEAARWPAAARSARPLVLEPGGTIRPGGARCRDPSSPPSRSPGRGGTLAVDLAGGRQLALTGALQQGRRRSALRVLLSPSAPLAVGATYTLATFTSTDAWPADFFAAGLGADRGVFLVGPTSLQFLVTGAGPTASYTHWAYHQRACPRASRAPSRIRTATGSRTCSSS